MTLRKNKLVACLSVFLFVAGCPRCLSMPITSFTDWNLDTIVSDSVAAGAYGETFRVPLPPVDASGNIDFGVLRIDVNQTTDDSPELGRTMLYLSTSPSHFENGVGPAWPVPHYTWAISSSGVVSITRCETDPLSAPSQSQHSAGNAGVANSGFLVEETSYTTAFCLGGLSTLPVAQRVGGDASAKDAPNSVCQCMGAPSLAYKPKHLYARARCYGIPGTTPDCRFTASVTTTCPLGTAASPGTNGKCGPCEVDDLNQNAASIVETKISTENTIASAQCLSQQTCPAGTKFVVDSVARDEITNYDFKSSKSGRRLASNAKIGRCEPCEQPMFSTKNSTSCEYTVTECPAGTFADWKNQACRACPKGTWSETEGATLPSVCVPCGKGKFSSTAGASTSHQCLGCPQDTFNDQLVSDSCAACPEGKLTLRPKVDATSGEGGDNNNNAMVLGESAEELGDLTKEKTKVLVATSGNFPEKECQRACREQKPCGAGEASYKCCKSYQLSKNSKACRITACPEDGICRDNDPPKCIGCENSLYYLQESCYNNCPAGYTGVGYNNTDRICVEAHNATTGDGLEGCKELCDIGQHYTESSGAKACIDCEGGADWCIGTWQCLGNRTADGCIKCVDGFYEVRRVCTPCPENAIASLIIVLIVVVVLLGVLFVFAGGSRPETSLSGLMIFLGHIQIQGFLLRFPVNWPPEFVEFMRVMSSIFTLDIPAMVPAPECSFKWTTESKYYSSMASMPMLLMVVWFPVVLATIYVGFCECRGCILCRKRNKNNQLCTALEKTSVHKAIAVSALILTVMYGFLSPASTELGLCQQRAGDQRTVDVITFMKSDPSIQCLWHHYFLSTLFGLVYALGIPLCIAVFLYWGKNKEKLWDEEHWIPDHVGWIYLRFEHSVFWWELVNMVTKTAIGVTERAGAGGGEEGLIVQLVITFFVLTVSLVLQVYFRPFASMLKRADIIHQPYTFTVRGGKKSHGVHLEEMGENKLGCCVKSVNPDAKYAPVADDEFQGSNNDIDAATTPKAHHMRMGDIVTHIDGMKLPHIYLHGKKRTMKALLHIKKDNTTIEAQVG